MARHALRGKRVPLPVRPRHRRRRTPTWRRLAVVVMAVLVLQFPLVK